MAYLIEVDSGMYAVDAGLSGEVERFLRIMRKLGRKDLRLIFITHAHLDHYGSAAALRRATGAPIAIHREDAEAMSRGDTIVGSARGRGKLVRLLLPAARYILRPEPTQPDIVLNDGDSLLPFGLDAIVLHAPGHTLGSCCLEVDERIVFAGDLISTTGKPHMQKYFAQDWELVAQSVARLQALKPELIYPGHGHKTMNEAMLLSLRPKV